MKPWLPEILEVGNHLQAPYPFLPAGLRAVSQLVISSVLITNTNYWLEKPTISIWLHFLTQDTMKKKKKALMLVVNIPVFIVYCKPSNTRKPWTISSLVLIEEQRRRGEEGGGGGKGKGKEAGKSIVKTFSHVICLTGIIFWRKIHDKDSSKKSECSNWRTPVILDSFRRNNFNKIKVT